MTEKRKWQIHNFLYWHRSSGGKTQLWRQQTGLRTRCSHPSAFTASVWRNNCHVWWKHGVCPEVKRYGHEFHMFVNEGDFQLWKHQQQEINRQGSILINPQVKDFLPISCVGLLRGHLRKGAEANLYLFQLPFSLPRSLSLSPPSSHSVGLHETERPVSEKGEFIWAHMP